MKIKLFNLDIRDKNQIKKINNSIKSVLKNKNFIKGKEVKIFERTFEKAINAKFCISCNSGTDALYLILKSLNLKKTDEVITTSHSWISTPESIVNAGGKPVFVDTLDDFNIDPKNIIKKINRNTKAILIVHLFGLPCNMSDIVKISKKYKLFLIEDCAQAHFSTYKKKYVGNFGLASAFSFFPTKTLGAFGDAGCVVTNNKLLAQKTRILANHGGKNKKDYFLNGINSRMDTLQAAVLNKKIKFLKKEIYFREKLAKYYKKYLNGCSQVQLPEENKHKRQSFYLYTIKANKRNKLKKWLAKSGIETGVYYPKILPFNKIYSKYKFKRSAFKNSLNNTNRMLSLPINSNMKISDVKYCANQILKFYKS